MRGLSTKAMRFAAAVVLSLCAMLLTGCGATLTVYDYTKDGLRYNDYELVIDGDTVRQMEESAVTDRDGRKYNVPDYFQELFSSYGYALTEASEAPDGTYSVRYSKSFADISTPELFQTGTTLDFITYYKDNPFVRTLDRKSPNPFNGIKAAYDEAGTEPNKSGTLIQQLRNGRVAIDENGERVVLFPAVQDAFPCLKGIDPEGLLLSYAQIAPTRMKSSGVKRKYDSDNSWYVFSRYFDRTEAQLEYEYERPVPYGWYLVALAAGGLTVAIFVLATRAKKPPKPTLLDRFPYNPEEFRDYETHLPAKRQ